MAARIPPLTLAPAAGDGAAPRAAAARVEALFREHYKALVAFAMHYTRRRDVAEDVVQEVFLQVWERCEREGDGAREFTGGYLFTAVRYQVLPLLRHERVARRWSGQAADVLRWDGGVSTPNAAETTLDADDLTRTVRRAVAGLSDKTRVVFLLSRERGLTYAEIAQVLAISVKTVELHMTRALKALRASLGGIALYVAVVAAGALVGAAGRITLLFGGG